MVIPLDRIVLIRSCLLPVDLSLWDFAISFNCFIDMLFRVEVSALGGVFMSIFLTFTI